MREREKEKKEFTRLKFLRCDAIGLINERKRERKKRVYEIEIFEM